MSIRAKVANLSPVHVVRQIAGMYYGWNIALVAFLSTGISVGMTGYAFGAFVEPLEDEFGWTRAQVNWGVALSFVSGVVAPIVGRLMDRVGARPVMVVSLLIMSTGFLLRSSMDNLWQFYLYSAVVYVGMPGATVMPAGRLVGMWFPKTRGRMMGMVTSGNNFGGLTIVPLAAAIIATAGWRWAFASLGLISAGLAVLVFLVIRERPVEVVPAGGNASAVKEIPGVSGRAALHSMSFYLITIGVTSGAFTYSVILSQMIPHLTSEGFSDGAAAAALTVTAAFGLSSKIIFGLLSEKITALLAFVLSLAIQAAGLVLFIIAGGSQLAWVAVTVFGLGFGGMGALIPLTLAEAFGLKSFGTIMGFVSVVGILPQLIGPLFAGYVFDERGSYTIPFGIIVGMFIVGGIALLAARRSPMSNLEAT
ncbi:MAG: MFS transporter [Chloroflexi bacterium]|nr:MFS transporter [Chloroflexota bacterium]